VVLFTGCLQTTNNTNQASACIQDQYLAYTNKEWWGGDTNITFTKVLNRDGDTSTCATLYNPQEDSKYYNHVISDTAASSVSGFSLPRGRIWPSDWGNPNRPGTSILANYTYNVTATRTKFMPLPMAGFGGACVDGSNLVLGQDFNGTCLRRIQSLEAECAPRLSALLYFEKGRFGSTRRIEPDESHWMDVAGQNITNNDTTVSYPPTATAFYDPLSQTCFNSLIALDYTILPLADFSIESIQITYSVANLKANADGSLRVEQRFTATFELPGGAPAGRAFQSVSQSGGRGYIAGMPILAGLHVTDSSGAAAVRQAVHGLQVFAPGASGLCSNTTETTVRVATGLSSCCTVKLTRAEFEARCNEAFRLDNYVKLDRIGKLGDADMTKTSDWLDLEGPSIPSSSYAISPSKTTEQAPVWNGTTLTCYGILGTTRLDLKYAWQGAYTSPQRAIIDVSQTYVRTTWRWDYRKENILTGTHDFQQCVTTAFSEVHVATQETSDTKLRLVFYPFWLSEWGVTARTQDAIEVTIACTCLFFFLFGVLHIPKRYWKHV